MNQDQSNRALNKPTPPTGSARPAESAALANAVRADSAPSSVLCINGGSSSIRFAVYEKGESPRWLLGGKVDRVGLSGTNLSFTDAAGAPRDRRAIESEDPDATENRCSQPSIKKAFGFVCEHASAPLARVRLFSCVAVP